MRDQVTIPARFNGPPSSANGGYACGLAGLAVGDRATVRLSAPPPLDRPLDLEREGEAVRLRDGETVVAEARPGAPESDAPAPPSVDEARRAAEGYRGRDPEQHAFPTCFVCGPLRADDGLAIFPGPAGDGERLACTWTPARDLAGDDGVVDPLFVWAALDCPSGFACMPVGKTSVLATMTTAILAPVHAGREYVLTAWPTGHDGRKHRAGSAIHDADGSLLAHADALWITLR